MRIGGIDIPGTPEANPKKTTGVGGKKSDSKVSPSGAPRKGDRVEISNAGGMMKAMRADYEKAPDVRMDKVDALKMRIENGEYHPQADEIADAIIRHVRQSLAGS